MVLFLKDMDAVMKPWKTLSRKILLETPVFKIWQVRRTSNDTGITGDFYTLETLDWVNVVAVTPDAQIVLIHQYRHGAGDITLEVPGGLVDAGEAPSETARRELREETGYTGDEPVHIGTVAPNPAIQTNHCYTYLIQNARPTAGLALEEYEEIETFSRPVADIPKMIRTGEIDHALVLNALYWYHLWQEESEADIE